MMIFLQDGPSGPEVLADSDLQYENLILLRRTSSTVSRPAEAGDFDDIA